MFSLFPNSQAPLSSLLNPSGVQLIAFVAFIVVIGALAAFGVLPSGDGDCAGSNDWGDADGGSCD